MYTIIHTIFDLSDYKSKHAPVERVCCKLQINV